MRWILKPSQIINLLDEYDEWEISSSCIQSVGEYDSSAMRMLETALGMELKDHYVR